MHFGRTFCAIIASLLIALPAAAQQTSPSVPPAPPPDYQAAPTNPPPFPPMPKREPRHRWVDMGSNRASHAHRRAAPARSHAVAHKTRRVENRAKADLSWCKSLSHRQLSHNKRCGKILKHESKARPDRDLSWCKSLSHRKLAHNSKCRKLLAREARQDRANKAKGSCESLSYRELVHNKTCRERLDRDAKAARSDRHKAKAHSSGKDRRRKRHRHG